MDGFDSRTDLDVAVVGAGPAGWALASRLRHIGIDAGIVAPEPEAPWRATYAVWPDELPWWLTERVGSHSLYSHVWPGVRVAGRRVRDLDRPYARLENEVLRDALGDLPTITATVTGVEHSPSASRLLTEAGAVSARLIIDASGASAVLTPHRPATAAQVAYGLTIASELIPSRWRSPSGCSLMDWRPIDDKASDEAPGQATFLYVLDDGQHALVEETSLVRRPPYELDDLRDRLRRRLGEDFTDAANHVERVFIPMGGERPRHRRGDRVVAFGAAGGYVHPATGYSVTASLRATDHVAATIRDALAMDDLDEAAGRVASAVWPMAQRRTRGLHDIGLGVLERWDAQGLRAFFDAFFDLPTDQWSTYLRVDAPTLGVMQAMSGVFRRLTWSQRRQLMRSHPSCWLRVFWPDGLRSNA